MRYVSPLGRGILCRAERFRGDGNEDFVTEYRSSEWASRAFCKQCGSGLWFRFLPTGNRSFSAGLFDGAAHHAIEKEIFVDERAEWCRIEGAHPRQTGAEVIAEAKAAGFTFD